MAFQWLSFSHSMLSLFVVNHLGKGFWMRRQRSRWRNWRSRPGGTNAREISGDYL